MTAGERAFSARFRLQPRSGLDENLRAIAVKGHEAIAFVAARGGDEDALFALNLAYEELMTNVARHALGNAVRPVRVECEITVSEDGEIGFLCRDDGSPFNPVEARPSAVKDPSKGGMGLELLRRFFPGMRYTRNGGWNETRLAYRFSAGSPAS